MHSSPARHAPLPRVQNVSVRVVFNARALAVGGCHAVQLLQLICP